LAIGLFAVTAAAALALPNRIPTRGLLAVALALALLIGTWSLLQTLPQAPSDLSNPVWATVLPAGALRPVSVAPGDTLAALVPTLLPFAVFIAALLLFPDDAGAAFLLRCVALSGVGCALFGVIEFLFFPQTLLFGPKLHYVGSLTATFTNRNTAATFLGTVLLLVVGQGFVAWQQRNGGGRQSARHAGPALVLWVLGAMIVLTALLLTQSRAGVAASLLGLAVSGGLQLALSRPGRPGARPRGAAWPRRLARLLAGLLGALFAVLVMGAFAGRVLLRVGVQGDEDGRFCMLPGMLRLLQDNWLLGSGLGTFRSVFPAYRNPVCGLSGIWDRAHDFYVEGWISLGVPFLIICSLGAAVLVAVIVRAILYRRRFRPLAIAALGVLVLVAAHATLDFSLQIPGFAAVFATLMAAISTLALGRVAPPRRVPGGSLPARQ
jgi:hypothetical protein